jgi:hypothetical protein
MLSMTTATASQLSRILLVSKPGRRQEPGLDTPDIRRYRLARLRLDGRPSMTARFEHLRRVYD